MKTATFSVLITLSALLPLLTAQGVDLTLQREASGSDVVRAAVNRIQEVRFHRQLRDVIPECTLNLVAPSLYGLLV